MSFLRTLLLCLWFGGFAGSVAQAALTVVVVSSERGGAYEQAAQALVGELERGGVSRAEVLDITVDELRAAEISSAKVFVALGARAAGVLAEQKTAAPLLCTLLPRDSFEKILFSTGRKSSAQLSALYLDLPLSRHVALIRRALPKALRLGVLWGPQSQVHAAELKAIAGASGMELVQATVAQDESLFPKLQSVLEKTDVLLAVVDPMVFNSNSIQNVLLTAFRARVPLVAFSPAYVRAGALFAMHVTPAQLGLQAAGMIRNVLHGGALPLAPVYSRHFSVAVNEHVARSLGLTIAPQILNANGQFQENTQ